MAESTHYQTVNASISTYESSRTSFISNRNSLMTKIATYAGSSNTALIIRSKTGTKFTIIFVKTYTYKGSSGSYYDIDIKGTGLVLELNTAQTISNIVSWCNTPSGQTSPYPASTSLTAKILNVKFYGMGQQMTVASVIQNSTLTDKDDNTIDEFSLAQFQNLCMGLAINNNAMPM